MRLIEAILREIAFRSGASIIFAGTLLFAAAAHAEDCGSGVQLRLSAPGAAQGSLLLATVRSANRLGQLTGKWNEREVPFWRAGEKEHFATENLTVKKQFVEPDPEQVARAEAETKRLREIFDRVTPERLWDGPFREPLDGVFKGTNFGRRRVLNGHPGSPHGGVDFPAPTGTPVHASQKGRVVLAEDLFFSGNTVVVDHGLGIYTLYCHFSETDAKVGDMVEAGTVLGKVGATGRVTGPHLHWGLTVERARVNALDIVRVLGKS
jgi:murein DD-endopeptidase MepM/ murein hydrolase activator NlpD